MHTEVGMKPTIAALFALSTLVSACATDDGTQELDVTLADSGGKADAIDGKSLRLRMRDVISMWAPEAPAQWKASSVSAWNKTKVQLTTSATVAVEASVFSFSGTDMPSFDESPWSGDKILQLSTEKRGTTATMGILLVDGATGAIVKCTKAGKINNVFDTVAIDLAARSVYADDVTFTFAECGIDEGADDGTGVGPVWLFGAVALPYASEGPLVGVHELRMKAELL